MSAAVITGIGSVSVYGPRRGRIPVTETQPRAITAWPSAGHAFLVEPFRVAEVAPGLKTRRLDRLSVWALVASALALEDAGGALDGRDRARVAVVCGTGFGCIDSTEAFMRSYLEWGYDKSDPIVFPESLGNLPAAHVARQFGLRGPNLTVGAKGVSGESALLEAASLLAASEADLVIALAGDVLTRPMHEWYEAAGAQFIPGEGLAAVVMEPEEAAAARRARAYARLRSGFLAGDPSATATSWGRDAAQLAAIIRRALGDVEAASVELAIAGANGVPAAQYLESTAIEEVFGDIAVAAPKRRLGEFAASGILALVAALSERPGCGPAVLVGTAAGGGRAALLVDLI